MSDEQVIAQKSEVNETSIHAEASNKESTEQQPQEKPNIDTPEAREECKVMILNIS